MDFGFRVIIFVLVVFAGQFFLQYFLSTRETKWPGLIIPVVNCLGGAVFALNATTIPAALTGFLVGGGIFCAINLLLYKLGRSRVRRRQADRVDKMNIQDLG